MGEVYRARDSRLDRIVAIKVLPASFAADAERLRRFEQEARSVAALNHPNILAVHDIGRYDSAPYMVCELLEGETLRERLLGGTLSSKKAVLPQGFAADSHRIVLIANARTATNFPSGVTGPRIPQLIPVDSGSPVREIKGLLDKDRPIQISADGNDIFVANYNGLSASIYRVHLQSGERRLVKTLQMRDPTGGFGVIRATTTPDGQYFAYGTLRQLSELYLLQGLN